MSSVSGTGTGTGTGSDRPAETPAQRRRRLDAIFGDVLPSTTRDERGAGGSREDSTTGPGAQDRWLREQVPPHHGGQ